MELIFYIIDTETNGIAKSHEINEISIIRSTDRVQLCRNIKCENPQNSSLDALRITNKTMADLLKGDPKEKAVDDCNNFFNSDGLIPSARVAVCHNAPFDCRFLQALWAKCNQQFPIDLWLCTMALTRSYIKQPIVKDELIKRGITKPKVNLHDACDLLEIKKISMKHNAKDDSRNSYLLWKKLIDDKQIDYLPLIKNIPHILNPEEECGLDPDLLDMD